ncbi:MAG TPA: SUMF1/EgtB/PvdO family nonheme iron enzyme [Pyrinomonadaceae bacterium]|jgi:formylglycine-generating enzyme required for sulfatase activity/predicted MPP superfamily phosphohydrolase
MSTLTWLHLSDIHLSESDSYNSNVVLESLLTDVGERIRADQLHPDFIALTGDIAFSSEPAQYALAQKFLDNLLSITGLRKERLFVVPGNHDVERRAVSFLAAGAPSLLNNNRNAVNELLSDIGKVDRNLILRRFRNYRQFVADYFEQHLPFDDEHYFYVKLIEAAGCRIAILGLNTAWMACSEKDRNQLLLGERQIRAALEEAGGADLCLALMHHPFDWLQDFDRNYSESMLYRSCHFILHGHMHRVGLQLAQTPNTDTMVIAAGASYESRDYRNSYNFVRLDLTELCGQVHLRKYSDDDGGFWVEDGDRYRDVPNGIFKFPLPKARIFVNSLLSKLEKALDEDNLEPGAIRNLNPKVIDRLAEIIQADFKTRRPTPSALHLRTRRQRRAFIALSRMSNEEAVGYLHTLCPAGMKLIPAGSFPMGSDRDDDARCANEHPLSDVWVNSFYLALYPVSNREYHEFIKAGGYGNALYWTKNGWLWVQAYRCKDEDKRPLYWTEDCWRRDADHPVQWLSWYEAYAYARWRALSTGAPYRLPTEAEWEKAAGWDEQKREKREYPWGNEFDHSICNLSYPEAAHGTAAVGSHSPECDSPYGIADMPGQVWEWVSSMRRAYPYNADDGREDLEAAGERVFRGGCWANKDPYVARCACRYYPDMVVLPCMNSGVKYEGPCGVRLALGFTEKELL